MTQRNAEHASENKRFPDGFRILQGNREFITYPERSSVRIWPGGDAYYYASHWHSAVEILLCTKGELICETDSRAYHLTEGQILFVPPETHHALTITQNSYRYLYLFEPDVLTCMRDMKDVEYVLYSPVYLNEKNELRDKVTQLLMEAADCYAAREGMWNMRCNAYFIEIYALLGGSLTEDEETQPNRTNVSVDSEMMNTVLTYIAQNYKDDITLESVAQFTGFSRFYFSRMFNAYTGCSFVDYLNRKRLSVADYMLVHSPKSIGEISEDSGFGSIATFNRVFKHAHGCSPSQFRLLYGDY